MRLAATWIIIDDNKRILLLKRSDYTKAFPGYWTIPGGRWENGETIEQIVVREVQEETGLEFTPTKLYHECVQENSGEDTHSHRFLWNWTGKIQIQEEEADGYGWYTYEETKSLKTAFNYRLVLDNLHADGLL